MSKRKKILILLCLGLILLIILGGYFLKSDQPAPPKPIAVVVATVTEQNVPLAISSLGNLIAPESTMLSAEQSGTITKIYFKNGQNVKKGDLLVQLDDVAQKASYDKDAAALVEAEAQYKRYVALNRVDPTVLSRAEMDQVYANYQEAKATLAGDAKTLSNMQIRAPFTGTLGATTLSRGSFINVGDQIVAIVNDEDLEAAYPIPENYFGLVKLRQKVTFSSDAYPNQSFPGTVVYKSPLVDETSRSFTVRARVDNPQGLSPGMLVRVNHILIAERHVLAVPTAALVPEVSGFGIYQIAEGKVTETYIKVGAQFGNFTEIISGLTSGDQIIVKGVDKVSPGMPVTVISGS